MLFVLVKGDCILRIVLVTAGGQEVGTTDPFRHARHPCDGEFRPVPQHNGTKGSPWRKAPPTMTVASTRRRLLEHPARDRSWAWADSCVPGAPPRAHVWAYHAAGSGGSDRPLRALVPQPGERRHGQVARPEAVRGPRRHAPARPRRTPRPAPAQQRRIARHPFPGTRRPAPQRAGPADRQADAEPDLPVRQQLEHPGVQPGHGRVVALGDGARRQPDAVDPHQR